MAFGGGEYNNGYANITYTTTWTDNTSSGTGVYVPPGQGIVVMPVAPVEPEPEGPLDWLRRRVDEVCEEAFAA